MAPAPDTWHQEWLGNHSFVLQPFLRRNKLGKICALPVDVMLDE
jgi:hypothetical protein